MSDIVTCGRCGKKYADRHLCTAPLSNECTMCQKQPAFICHRCFQIVAAERDELIDSLEYVRDYFDWYNHNSKLCTECKSTYIQGTDEQQYDFCPYCGRPIIREREDNDE